MVALNLLSSPALSMALTLAQENRMQVSIESIFTFRLELEEGECALVWNPFFFFFPSADREI